MRKSDGLLLLIFLLASCLTTVKPAFSLEGVAENTWTQKAPMQVARSDLGVAVVNEKIYAIGGRAVTYQDQTRTVTEEVGTNEEYDPATDTWTFKASMPTPSSLFAIAVYGGKIYIMGSGKNQVYDPANDTWENKTPMPTARMGRANVVNGKIYLMGGYPNTTLIEMYDPETDTWTTKTPMPTEPAGPSGVIDNKIYVVGSYFEANSLLDFGDVSRTQIYDTKTDSWSLGSAPPEDSFVGSVGVTVGFMAPKRMYVFSGGGQGNQVYDPEADSWTYGADDPMTRYGFAVAVVDDVIYVIGGVYSYDPTPTIPLTEYDLLHPDTVTIYYSDVEAYTPFGYGTVPPVISVASPENRNYTSSEVALNFTVNRHVDWIGYSLDGDENVSVTGNTSLTGLSVGLHNVTVYARDEFGNTGASETVVFNVEVPFPVVPVAAASAASVALIGVGLLVYFKKRRR